MAPNAHFAWLNRLLRTVPWVRVGSAWTTLLLELLYPATTLLELALPRSIAASLLSLSFSSVAMGMHMMIMASTGIHFEPVLYIAHPRRRGGVTLLLMLGINFKLLYIAHLVNLPELCFLLGRLRGALSESPDAELSPPLLAARAAKVAGAGGGDGGGVCSLGRALALSCGAAAAMSPLYFIVADVDWWPVSNYKVFCDHRKFGKTITAYRYAFGARGVEHQCGIGRLVGVSMEDSPWWLVSDTQICLTTHNEVLVASPGSQKLAEPPTRQAVAKALCAKDGAKACDWQCYLNRYADLRKDFGDANVNAAAAHFRRKGKAEGRNCSCPGSAGAPVPEYCTKASGIANGTGLLRTFFYGWCEDEWWSAYESNSKLKEAKGRRAGAASLSCLDRPSNVSLSTDSAVFEQLRRHAPANLNGFYTPLRVTACSIFVHDGAACARRSLGALSGVVDEAHILVGVWKRTYRYGKDGQERERVTDMLAHSFTLKQLRDEVARRPCISNIDDPRFASSGKPACASGRASRRRPAPPVKGLPAREVSK